MANESAIITLDSVKAALSADWSKIPEVLYSTFSYDLPLTAGEAAANFGSSINFLSTNRMNAPSGASTSLISSNVVSTPILVMGIGVYLYGDPRGLSLPGVAVPTGKITAGAYPEIHGPPGVVPANVYPAGWGITDADVLPATLNWGQPVWDVTSFFCHAYRFSFKLGKFEIFNEKVSDVGLIRSEVDPNVHGNSVYPVHELIREVNDVYAAKNFGYQFFPQNTALAPSQTTAPGAVLFPPTAEVKYGAPFDIGVSNCFYRLGKPILVFPSMPIQAELVAMPNDPTFNVALQAALNNHGLVEIANNVTGAITGVTNSKGGSYEFTGGEFRVGLGFKGFELTPQACLNWFQTYGHYFGDLYAGVQMPFGVQGAPGQR